MLDEVSHRGVDEVSSRPVQDAVYIDKYLPTFRGRFLTLSSEVSKKSDYERFIEGSSRSI
jgi:hypothetical protein